MNRKFSSRVIEGLCKTDIRFMWLLNGEPAPNASTIVRFKRGHLAEAIELKKRKKENSSNTFPAFELTAFFLYRGYEKDIFCVL